MTKLKKISYGVIGGSSSIGKVFFKTYKKKLNLLLLFPKKKLFL